MTKVHAWSQCVFADWRSRVRIHPPNFLSVFFWFKTPRQPLGTAFRAAFYVRPSTRRSLSCPPAAPLSGCTGACTAGPFAAPVPLSVPPLGTSCGVPHPADGNERPGLPMGLGLRYALPPSGRACHLRWPAARGRTPPSSLRSAHSSPRARASAARISPALLGRRRPRAATSRAPLKKADQINI